MFNFFKRLGGIGKNGAGVKGGRVDVVESAKDAGLSVDVLTEMSARMPPPSFVKFDLWKHQEAMLKRCVDIEQKAEARVKLMPTNAARYDIKTKPVESFVNVGIMNDPPGCGKTAVALSLMALDLGSLNMVIVPSHIHKQWTDAIDAFLPAGKFKYTAVTDYRDTLDLDMKLKHMNLVITTQFFADLISSMTIVPIKRVFIDEIDTIGPKSITNVPVSDFVWFMSASFNPLVDRQIGPFDLSVLSEKEILQRVCKCDLKFMTDCQPKLMDPLVKVKIVPDGELAIFKGGLAGPEAMSLMNALNLQRAKRKLLARLFEEQVKTPKDLALAKVKEVKKDIEQLEKDIDDIIKHEYMSDEDKKEGISKLSPKIDELTEYMGRLEESIEAYVNPTETERTKMDEIRELCEEIAAKPGTQWLFFCDDDYVFDLIRPLLTDKGIKFTSLDQGTLEKNEKELKRYKSGEVTVLFINSVQEGVGINLENTTHIVFLHYTNPKMIDQLVCRAQRPGRKNQLEIVCLYHKNEADQSA